MAKTARRRVKNSPNKITNEAKRAILMAFDKIGGAQRLADWILKDPANETAFWTKIFPKLLPRPPAEAAPTADPLPPVRGALIWEKPTPAPYPPFAASTAAATVASAAASTGPAATPGADEPPG